MVQFKRLFCHRIRNNNNKNKEEEDTNNDASSSFIMKSIPTKRRSILRVSSVDESLHCQGLAPSNDDEARSIQFGNVFIRDYERIAGDNPSVTRGVPIGLGWNYIEYESIHLNDYEQHKISRRRSKAELVMSPQIRQSILKMEWNVSQREIATAVRKSIKRKNQRRQTIIQGENHQAVFYQYIKKKLLLWKNKKNDDDDDDQCDYMDCASDAMQSGSLDSTRHKGAVIIAIEDEDCSCYWGEQGSVAGNTLLSSMDGSNRSGGERDLLQQQAPVLPLSEQQAPIVPLSSEQQQQQAPVVTAI